MRLPRLAPSAPAAALLAALPLLAGGCQHPQPPTPTPASAPGPAAAPPAPAQDPVVLADAAGTTVLATGQLLRIALEGNPSTGYTWMVDEPLPPQLALVEGLPGGPAADGRDGARPRVGAPQVQWLHLRAIAPGEAELALRWQRPWETSAAPARQARYRITVR